MPDAEVNLILETLDVEAFCAETGCSRDAALPALHKARYERVDMAPELRHASRAWLETNGHDRWRSQPWPAAGVLPGRMD